MTRRAPVPIRAVMQRVARLGFFVAAIVALVMALLPKPPPLPGSPPDSLLHAFAFATLAVLAVIGFPRLTMPRIVGGLAVFGGLIELAQAIPALNRHSELRDLVVDVFAAAVAAGIARRLMPQLRKWTQTPSSGR